MITQNIDSFMLLNVLLFVCCAMNTKTCERCMDEAKIERNENTFEHFRRLHLLNVACCVTSLSFVIFSILYHLL